MKRKEKERKAIKRRHTCQPIYNFWGAGNFYWKDESWQHEISAARFHASDKIENDKAIPLQGNKIISLQDFNSLAKAVVYWK